MSLMLTLRSWKSRLSTAKANPDRSLMGDLKWMFTLKRRPSILMIEFTFAFSRRVFSRGRNA